MAEPTSIELVIGDNSTQKAEVPDYRASQSTKEQKKSVSIPASDVPGRHVFVVMMHFLCSVKCVQTIINS